MPEHKKRPRRAKTLRGNVLALSIFPGRCQPSIVDRNELNYRVRNGNGWTLILISTNSMSSGTARKQTILYCPSCLLSRLFQSFIYIPIEKPASAFRDRKESVLPSCSRCKPAQRLQCDRRKTGSSGISSRSQSGMCA